MRRLREQQPGERSRTVAWLPTHLSDAALPGLPAARRHRQGARRRAAASTPSTPATSTPTTGPAPRASSKTQRESLLKTRQGAPSSRRTGSPQKKADRVDVRFDDHFVAAARRRRAHACPSGSPCATASGTSRASCSPTSTPPTRTWTPTAPAPRCKPADARKVFRHIRAAAEAAGPAGRGAGQGPGADAADRARRSGSGSRRRRTSSCPRAGPTTSGTLAGAEGVTG